MRGDVRNASCSLECIRGARAMLSIESFYFFWRWSPTLRARVRDLFVETSGARARVYNLVYQLKTRKAPLARILTLKRIFVWPSRAAGEATMMRVEARLMAGAVAAGRRTRELAVVCKQAIRGDDSNFECNRKTHRSLESPFRTARH